MSAFQFCIASLCCYRLTVLFARDAGPREVMKKLRKGNKLLSCPFCVSVWMGALLEFAFYLFGVRDLPVMCFCLALGMSAVSIILDRCFTADYQA